jgi:hypothetical protein
MESASTTDDGSTEVAQRKRLHKRERTEDCFAQNDGTVYENKAFNSLQYQDKLCHRFVFHFNHVGTIRGSFEVLPAGPDRVSAAETWRNSARLVGDMTSGARWSDT